MNYTSAAVGVIALISVVTWLTTGRNRFTGPHVATMNASYLEPEQIEHPEHLGENSRKRHMEV